MHGVEVLCTCVVRIPVDPSFGCKLHGPGQQGSNGRPSWWVNDHNFVLSDLKGSLRQVHGLTS